MTHLSYAWPHGLQETSFIILQEFSKSSVGFCWRSWKILTISCKNAQDLVQDIERSYEVLSEGTTTKKYPIKRLRISRSVSMNSINSFHQQLECHYFVGESLMGSEKHFFFLPTLLSTGIMCKSLSKAKKKLDTVWAWTPYEYIINFILNYRESTLTFCFFVILIINSIDIKTQQSQQI